MIDIVKVLGTVAQVGALTPAFKSLFDIVTDQVAPVDQSRLRHAYQAAQQDTDREHREVQNALRDAAQR